MGFWGRGTGDRKGATSRRLPRPQVGRARKASPQASLNHLPPTDLSPGQERTILTEATGLGTFIQTLCPPGVGIETGAGKSTAGHASVSAYTRWVLMSNVLAVSGTGPAPTECFLR